ncbi:MAG TPA: PIN domain-containing protein [Spirochaetota bacterium]|nr:PIN domain-containing protein [Spirochaetota bacterium]HOJ28413.1 PIN domain-containing protein [Spirochaetota bacterium]HOM09576.1 PIN domain-containing protein [Spirochaetota bacterium]HPP49436.1 PIN domain-containing protein [Spirochaetota bacterium]
MPKKVFIDTNILIYAFSETEPLKRDTVISLLEFNEIILSTQVINEFIWVLNKKFKIHFTDIKKLITSLVKNFSIATIDMADIVYAIDIAMKYKFSYWDSLIISSAIKNNCIILYTEDLQNNQVIKNKIKIINPFI